MCAGPVRRPWRAAPGIAAGALVLVLAGALPVGAEEELPVRPFPPTLAEPATGEPGEPATAAARRVLSMLSSIRDDLRVSHYQHATLVRPEDGLFNFDCSGMAEWVIARAARGAHRGLYRWGERRIVARTFYRRFQASPRRRQAYGWEQIARVTDVRPGDLFAWETPRGWPSDNTGHVGFAIAPARPVDGVPGAYTMRVVDSTSVPHQHDTRLLGLETGFGEGTMLWMTDEQGRAIGYGWNGTRSPGVVLTDILFGRVHR